MAGDGRGHVERGRMLVRRLRRLVMVVREVNTVVGQYSRRRRRDRSGGRRRRRRRTRGGRRRRGGLERGDRALMVVDQVLAGGRREVGRRAGSIRRDWLHVRHTGRCNGGRHVRRASDDDRRRCRLVVMLLKSRPLGVHVALVTTELGAPVLEPDLMCGTWPV